MHRLKLSVNLESLSANYLLGRLLVGRNKTEQGSAFTGRAMRIKVGNLTFWYFYLETLISQNLTDLALRVISYSEELGLPSTIADK